MRIPVHEHRPGVSRILCLAALLLAAAGCDRPRSRFGTRLDYNGSGLYYTKDVTAKEAKRLGKYLKLSGYFKQGRRTMVQLAKPGKAYQVRLVFDKEKYDAAQLRNARLLDGARFSRHAFDGKPVELHLTDEDLKPFQVLKADEIGSVIQIGMNEVHYSGGVREALAWELADLLFDVGYFKGRDAETNLSRAPGSTVHLKRKEGGYVLGLTVGASYKSDSGYPRGYQSIGARVSRDVLGGKPVEVRLVTAGAGKTWEVLKPLGE